MIYKNGSKYEGEFTYDRPHGYGVLVEAEGRVLKGLWENGKFVEPIFM
jgi:MORN repeat.